MTLPGVLDDLAIRKANVFGVSMGGVISQRFALNHPDRVSNMVLGCATPTRTFRYQAEAIAGEDTWDELATLTSPTLLITGSEERLVPCGNSQKMAKRIPGAELVMLKGMRHGFYIEAIEETIDAIDGFIKKNTSQ